MFEDGDYYAWVRGNLMPTLTQQEGLRGRFAAGPRREEAVGLGAPEVDVGGDRVPDLGPVSPPSFEPELGGPSTGPGSGSIESGPLPEFVVSYIGRDGAPVEERASEGSTSSGAPLTADLYPRAYVEGLRAQRDWVASRLQEVAREWRLEVGRTPSGVEAPVIEELIQRQVEARVETEMRRLSSRLEEQERASLARFEEQERAFDARLRAQEGDFRASLRGQKNAIFTTLGDQDSRLTNLESQARSFTEGPMGSRAILNEVSRAQGRVDTVMGLLARDPDVLHRFHTALSAAQTRGRASRGGGVSSSRTLAISRPPPSSPEDAGPSEES